MGAQPCVDFGAEICGSLESRRQARVAGDQRPGRLCLRHHLRDSDAPLSWPADRRACSRRADERCWFQNSTKSSAYDGRSYELGAIAGRMGRSRRHGFRLIERFRLEGTTPVWTFVCADALIEKRVWMQDGANTTFVRYELLRGATR